MEMKTFAPLLFSLLLFSCKKDEKISAAAHEMRTFVTEISNFAKAQDPDFLIIPQNGMELCFIEEFVGSGFYTTYTNAIDGVGIEGLFYYQGMFQDSTRLVEAEEIGQLKPVLVSDYVDDNSQMVSSYSQNDEYGFLAYPRAENNEAYRYIPTTVHNENNNDIHTLSDAQNYLYLISVDEYSSKTEFLNAIAATNFDVILIDLYFDNDAEPLSVLDVASLKVKANGGSRLVIAYMNIGAAEKFRYYWQNDWKEGQPNWIKKKYKGYKDEFWVEYWTQEWKNIIYGNENSYTQKILDAGFDGAYLDNIEGYYFLYK
jgi:cysteinyl-tRNA synthetase, unknown class